MRKPKTKTDRPIVRATHFTQGEFECQVGVARGLHLANWATWARDILIRQARYEIARFASGVTISPVLEPEKEEETGR